MKLQEIVLKRPVSVILIIAAIVIFGISSILGIRMEYFPDLEMPMQVVSIVYPGADADSIERLVTEKIEDCGESLAGINNIASSSYANYAVIQFTYDYGTDMDDAYQDLKEQLDLMVNDLPSECQTPTIMQISLNSDATISLALQGKEGMDISDYVSDTLEPKLKALNGVAEVDITGQGDEYVRIVLNEEKMAQYGLSMESVANYVSAADFDIPAGTIKAGNQEVGVSALTELDWQSDLENISIRTQSGSVVRLGDVADFINLYKEEADSISRYNQKDSVLIDVTKRSDSSTIEVCNEVLEVFNTYMGEGMEYEVIHSSADDIMDNLMEVLKTLVEGVLISMFVLFLFFGDLKASLIVGSSMPLSLLASMILLKFMGINLDLMTGTGLIIAIGMIVDNSIVILESCFRMKEEGISYKKAAIKGTGIMMMSVFGSTLTTIVVYAPLTTTQGMAGQMNQPLCFSIIFTMIASLISAITVVPFFFNKIKPKEKKDIPINRILAKINVGYDKLIRVLLRNRKKTVAAVLAMLAGSICLAATLNFDLFPSNYDGSIEVTAQFRSGTTQEVMDASVQEIEQALCEDEEFESVNLNIADSTAVLKAYSSPKGKRSSEEATDYYTTQFQGLTNMDVSVTPLGTASGIASLMSTGNNVTITLAGDDLESLREGTSMVEEGIKKIPGIIKLENELSKNETIAKLVINPRKVVDAGLTPAGLASEIYRTLSGVTVMTIEQDSNEYNVVLEYPEDKYADITSLLDKEIALPNGQRTNIGSMADIEYTSIMQQINRQDGKYVAEVTATTTSTAKYQAQADVKKMAGNLSYPQGVSVVESASDKSLNEEMGKMGSALAAAVLLVFLVMAIQFESVRFAIMVMMCIPFSIIGSFTLMFLAQEPLSMMAMMGFLMLIGIVVNNGILLVDTINQFRAEMPLEEALVEAGKVRLRPILMTTLTTVLSMLPLVLSTASGVSMMKGMGLVIVGGLLASTLMAMFFMPVLYMIFDKKRKKPGHDLC